MNPLHDMITAALKSNVKSFFDTREYYLDISTFGERGQVDEEAQYGMVMTDSQLRKVKSKYSPWVQYWCTAEWDLVIEPADA